MRKRGGILILTCTTGLLFVLALLELPALGSPPGAVLALGLGLAGLAFGFRMEWKSRGTEGVGPSAAPPVPTEPAVPVKSSILSLLRRELPPILGVCGGALLTWLLHTHGDLNTVAAVGLTGLAAALLLPRLAPPLYCGAFVGMASPALFPLPSQVLLAGFLAALVYVLVQENFRGWGGRLGAIALTGCVAAMWLTGSTHPAAALPDWSTLGCVLPWAAAAAALTWVAHTRLLRCPVLSSALVGLAAGLLLPYFDPQTGEILAAAVLCASFAGMSTPERGISLPVIAAAGAFAGLLFICTAPVFHGTGGKLGTAAFGSMAAVQGLADLARSLCRPAAAASPAASGSPEPE